MGLVVPLVAIMLRLPPMAAQEVILRLTSRLEKLMQTKSSLSPTVAVGAAEQMPTMVLAVAGVELAV